MAGVNMHNCYECERLLLEASRERDKLRSELAAQADRDDWKRTANRVKVEIALLQVKRDELKAKVEEFRQTVMPRSEFLDLLEQRDALLEQLQQLKEGAPKASAPVRGMLED